MVLEYATQSFEAIMAQEVTKRKELEMQAKAIEAQIEDSKSQQIRAQHEERRKTLKVGLLLISFIIVIIQYVIVY